MTSFKQAKLDMMLDSLKKLMLEADFSTLTIAHIAKQLDVGEATIYRYFGNRVHMIIEVGVSLWNDIYERLLSIQKKQTGFESVQAFFGSFIEDFDQNHKIFQFLRQFDSLMMKEHVNQSLLQTYDDVLLNIKAIYDQFFEQGIDDGSIKPIDQTTYYYTTTHLLLGIAYRIVSQANMLPSDALVDGFKQMSLALDMCLEYIRRKD